MPDYETLRANLERRGFDVTYFETAAQAADYLDRKLDGKTVGHGGALTLTEMGLPERLSSHAAVFSHWSGGTFQQAAAAPIYLTSVNALAETGELVNIDGTGNRVASTLFGHEEVYFIGGQQDRSGLRLRPLAGPEHRLPQKRTAAAQEDPLRRQGGALLRLQQP